jgi:hypothetical protein
MRHLRPVLFVVFAATFARPATAQIPLTVVNSGFEVGSPQDVPPGWTPIQNFFWIGNFSPAGADPASGYLSPQFISANWQYGGLPNANSLVGGDANSALIRQDIDLTPYSSQISEGGLYLGLSYAYFHNDGNDLGTISYQFLDGSNSTIGAGYNAQTQTGGGWRFIENLAAAEVPSNAAKLRISLGAQRTGVGSARNIAFDAISASLQPAPPPPPPKLPSGIVNGNLIQFDGSGAWTWYSDERAIVDPNNGHVLVNSVGFAPSYPSGGDVDVVNFDPETGRRVRTPLSTIQVDDHNNGSLLVLPDGRYLAMYANHGNNGGLGDRWSRWRRSINPGDSTSWTTEQLFDWFNAVPGANETGNPNAANVSYHNLFYLSAENQVYNISRSYGQLSTNEASQNMPNIMRYNIATNTVEWAGQLLESEAQGYSAYPKYASNGVDRIYFTTTETHPRNYNNSVFSGYIQNGQTFDMLGNVVDANIFDNGTTAGGSGFVPDVTDFTPVHMADPLGEGYNRLWTVDMNLDADGSPMALYISRWNPDGSTSAGSTTNPIDHRLHYALWNAQSQQWETNEVTRMGNRLYRLPSDMSEQDYTGNAALVPGDPSTIYVSTPYDPRDPSGETFTTSYEIYRGETSDGGGTWDWTAVTENSVVDNLRPIIPDPHGGPVTVMWFRGTYTTAHSINATIVGIVERPNEQLGLVNYIDANASNTTYANGAALQTSTPSGGQGPADGLWHVRNGFGNGNNVLTSSESGSENAPMLKTTIDGATLEDGTYDIFAYFWSDVDEDWRLLAGLESNNLLDFRRYGSQHAPADQFMSIETVSANGNDLLLYRAYLGRMEVVDGADIEVFIDDWQSFTGGAIRTWYDGVGYALVSPTSMGLPGDFNGDGFVDAADYTVWRNHLGTNFDLNGNGDESGDSGGVVDLADYTYWKQHYGSSAVEGAGELVSVPEPATVVLLMLLVAALVSACRTSGLSVRGFRVATVARPWEGGQRAAKSSRCARRCAKVGGGGFAHL